MASLYQLNCLHYHRPRFRHLKILSSFSVSKKLLVSGNVSLPQRARTSLGASESYGKTEGALHVRNRTNSNRFLYFCKASGAEIETTAAVSVDSERTSEDENPHFDINLAVILAGFAFEAYTTPLENAGTREVDAANCQTLFLSETFVREIYDGQLFIKLKKGFNFPAMDPWGTSDPYVVLELGSQVVKSNVKWGTKEPSWNEEFTLNIKQPTKNLQVAAWDANLFTPHKRMGNTEINLETVCDGDMHEILVDLDGMGGGGKIQLEIKYKSFERIDQEKNWWKIPIVTDFLQKHGFESALKNIVGSESVQARQFVEFAFGQLKSLNDAYLQKNVFPNDKKGGGNSSGESGTSSEQENNLESPSNGAKDMKNSTRSQNGKDLEKKPEDGNMVNHVGNGGRSLMNHGSETSHSDKHFWKKLSDTVNQNVVQRFGLPVPEKIKWDGFELLNKIGLQSQDIAEARYVESGLATPKDQSSGNLDEASGSETINANQTSLPDIKKVTQDLLKQTDAVLGALMVLNATVSQFTKGAGLLEKDGKEGNKTEAEPDVSRNSQSKVMTNAPEPLELDERKAEEMRALFSKAESAMEAWAMLATSLGHPSFIKSEFEKICFLDNPSTDTQLTLWCDSARKRLVVAFRGTEQAKWKDLLTDLMLVPAGLNPERIGGDFKQEVQVHSGFLSAYDSVRTRLIILIKQVVGFVDDSTEPLSKWHVFVTGHSLGGALATLLALELSSSQMAKRGAISVTMYNFGSPRVGNKKFAEVYNKKVKDSWRVVNHRDIIPTVPRLMGYCHVAQPVYLAAGEVENTLENMDPIEEGYQGDVIGEATPDVLVSEFMKGEKQLIEKILNTEINIFRSIRDGSALMQHMEDFYYITLLENVRSNYRAVPRLPLNEDNSL